MTKHQRVQIKPVHMREKFCAKDSFSAGRAKSETPARTRAHCLKDEESQPVNSPIVIPPPLQSKKSDGIIEENPTFMTGAQKCTVLMPTSLSHAFLNQLVDCCCSPDAVLCHRLPCWRNCWRKNCWFWLVKKGEDPAARWRRMGRAARRMLLVGAMACEKNNIS